MAVPKISEENKKKLRLSAKAELERLEVYFSNQEVVQLLDDFKNKFNICESVYKIILAEHQRFKGKPENDYLKVSMLQVPHALSFAGYTFDKTLLNELFGASSQNGKTVKKLRDAITHSINDKAVQEIITRKEELFGYMDAFLSVIRTFDAAA